MGGRARRQPGGSRGDRGGRDAQLSATSGTMPAPGDSDGGGASESWFTAGGTNGDGTSTDMGGCKVSMEWEAAGLHGGGVAVLGALGRRRGQRGQELGREGFKGLEAPGGKSGGESGKGSDASDSVGGE